MLPMLLAATMWRPLRLLTGLALLAPLLACEFATAQLPVESFTEPYRRIDVAPAEPGTVSAISVREGDRVQQGEVVATLEHDSLLVARDSAIANIEGTARLNAARAERSLRERRLQRLQKLHTQGYANHEEIAQAEGDLEVAAANVQLAEEQQALEALELRRLMP